jgi:hypothetical protein
MSLVLQVKSSFNKKKKKKNLDQKNDNKNIIKHKKILKTLLNMHVIVIKYCVSHFKFVLFLNYVLTNCLMIKKMKNKILYLYVILVERKLILNNWTWL